MITATSTRSLVLLYAPSGVDMSLAAKIENELAQLAGQAGYTFNKISETVDTALTDEVLMLVVLPPDPGIVNLASAHPEIQFLGVGIPNLQPSQNISVILSEGVRPDHQGFLAGYIATVLTNDWRVGVISSADSAAGNAARNAFINGVIFFCGLCRPVSPPFIDYPVFYNFSSPASVEEYQSAVEFMNSQGVKTVYVPPGVGDQTLLEMLAQSGIMLLGGIDPPPAVQENWVASVQADYASTVREIWPRIINGERAIMVSFPLAINHRKETFFSIGRQRHVEKVLQELLSGYIDTGVDPLTGELKY